MQEKSVILATPTPLLLGFNAITARGGIIICPPISNRVKAIEDEIQVQFHHKYNQKMKLPVPKINFFSIYKYTYTKAAVLHFQIILEN